MKWLFLILLAANLAYYFLGSATAPDATHTSSAAAEGTPTILLLREAKQQGQYPIPARAPVSESAPRADSAAQTPRQAPDRAPGQTPDQTSAPTADDLHRAVYPEGDATGQTSSQSATLGAGDDDQASDANATPAPSPREAQPRQATRGEAPKTGPANTTRKTRKPEADTPRHKTKTGDATPNQGACFRVGPFNQVAAAKAAGRQMMKLGFRGRLLQSTAQLGTDYQVYLGPYNDPDERQFALDELTESGIDNITLGRGKHENTLLIAAYPSRKQAKPMLATLQTLGYNPHVAKQSKPVRRFYLDLEALDSSGSLPPRDRLSEAFPGIGLKSRTCRR